ncbi:MAG: ComEC/Rec2 family competence protein [Varibaculum sp.]|nr:ComEC/Rec2 family competence protein [Varibaculum sp.]
MRRTWPRIVDIRLLPAAVLAWLSVALTIAFPEKNVWVPLTAAAVGTGIVNLLLSRWHGRRRGANYLLALFLAIAIAATCAVAAQVRVQVLHGSCIPVPTGQRIQLTARVVNQPALVSGDNTPRYRVMLRAEQIDGVTRSVKVLVYLDEPVNYRDLIRGTVTLHKSDTPGVCVQGNLHVSQRIVNRSIETLKSVYRPIPGAGMLLGMGLGDRTLLSLEQRDDLNMASLSHVTAISGLHISVLLALWRQCTRRRLPRLFGSLMLLGGLLVVIGPAPSLLRAVIMGTIGISGALMSRLGQALSALSLTVLLMLLINPLAALEYGFTLSVAATAGIVMFTKPLSLIIGRVLPSVLAEQVSLTCSAQLFVMPVVLLLRPGLPTWAIPANVLVAPVVATIVSVGLLNLMLVPFAIWPVQVLAWASSPLTNWVILVAHTAAHGPLAPLPWPDGVFGVVLLVAVVLLCLIVAAGMIAAFGRSPAQRIPVFGKMMVLHDKLETQVRQIKQDGVVSKWLQRIGYRR